MKQLLKDLNIDETFTKKRHRKEVFNHVKNSIRHAPDYNFMADILMLPKTKEGYRYLFLMVDLYTDEFDGVALKEKTATSTLDAFKTIIKRGIYLTKPHAIQTDSGSEFKGPFHDYMYEQNILHTQVLPGRHKQMSSVESLNRQIGRLLNGYMNSIEEKTGETYTDWTSILASVIKRLNKYRKERRGSIALKDNPYLEETGPDVAPKFKIGDIVHQKLDRPENALGHKQNTEAFREGDYRYSKVPKKIIKVIVMDDEPFYRYMLDGIKNCSYTENELFLSKHTVEQQVVKQIIGKRTVNKKKEYLIWWKGELKKMATWEPKENLVEDGLGDTIALFEKKA